MKKGVKIISIVTLLLLIGFSLKAISESNYEFLGYWIVSMALFLAVIVLDKKFNFPLLGIGLFSIWMILHMAGGLIKISGTRLYEFMFFNILGDPFYILKYDQVIHAYCYFVITILAYFALKYYFKKSSEKSSKIALIIFSIAVALGIGVLNEIIEFGMVVFANAGNAVGDYFNTALDLVFNLIGAVIGAIFSKIFLDKEV